MAYWVRTLLVTGPPEEVAAAALGHLDQLRELKAQGKLRVAGELAGGDGYVEIYEAADRLEAESIARASPLVVDGLASWMLRQWNELAL